MRLILIYIYGTNEYLSVLFDRGSQFIFKTEVVALHFELNMSIQIQPRSRLMCQLNNSLLSYLQNQRSTE